MQISQLLYAKYMKVVTSAPTRFWIFEQAQQLARRGHLHRLITWYPRRGTRAWHIPDDSVSSLPLTGGASYIAGRLLPALSPPLRLASSYYVHRSFACRVAQLLPLETQVLITLSSFGLEAIRRGRERGICTVVDHGSLHERTERDLLRQVQGDWNLSARDGWPPPWVIDREDQEFLAADYIFVLSRIARRTLVEHGVPASKIIVNNPGVDLSQFHPAPRHDRTFRIIQVGSITARKGVLYLLKAFTELNLPTAELWFVGGGLESSPLRPIIRSLATERVVFRGSVPQSKLRDMYAQCDVAVLASVADGFGLVVPQAMACSLPVIVTENVGAADVLSPDSGLIVPIRDVEALKAAILTLYDDPARRTHMGESARRRVTSGHTWDDYGNRLDSFLSSAGARSAH